MLGSRRTFRSFLFYTNQLAVVNEFLFYCVTGQPNARTFEKKNNQAGRLFISLTCIRYI